MLKVTAQQRANAIEARDVFWPSVPPEQVTERLGTWFCGTHACFGGWCTRHPAFIAQGLYARETVRGWGPRPAINIPGRKLSSYGDSELFGDTAIFSSRGDHPADKLSARTGDDPDDEGYDFEGTDHELVTRRLNWLIQNSEVVDA